MRRLLVALVAGVLCIGLVPTATAKPASPKDWSEFFEAVGSLEATMANAETVMLDPVQQWRFRQCRFQSLDHALWTDREERLTAQCAVDRWSVPGGMSKFMAVGSCESGWNRFASNAGNYLGIFQHAAGAWLGRVHAAETTHLRLNPKWTNSRTQVIVTAKIAHASGWGAWSCA